MNKVARTRGARSLRGPLKKALHSENWETAAVQPQLGPGVPGRWGRRRRWETDDNMPQRTVMLCSVYCRVPATGRPGPSCLTPRRGPYRVQVLGSPEGARHAGAGAGSSEGHSIFTPAPAGHP
ncbi:hypothetical protein HJG60_011433 [Phyllostomus discolor]|uniref:Uncharacterized protein n=1 Tax=Phyllostomus discolor TaxID=89673 RepID=A0A834A4T6_9CHIR|nr:hypothetical protein HJG60_011433 [Phyllostomus discolor]